MRFFCNAGSSKVSTTTATATNLSDKGPVVKMEGSLYTLSNVENTFFDTPESQAKALDQLKAILKESTNNGKFDEFDEMTMKRALWAKRNNVKSALKVMQGFQTLQEKYGKEIKLDEIKNFENRKIMIFDQNITDSDGFPIIYGGFLEQLQTMPDTDTMLKPYQMSNLLLDDILRFIIYYVQHVTQDPAIARYGITLVADLGGLSKYNQVNFSMVKQILGLLQSSLPVRLHKIIIVDAPAFFGMVWAIVKHFVSSEIHSKICLIRSNDTNTLAVHLKIELLPERLEMQCLCSAGSRSKSVIGNGGTGTMGGYLPYQQVNNSTIVSIRLWNGVSYARCIDHETRVSGVISQVVEKLCLAYPNSFAPPKSDDFVATVVEKDIIPEPNDTFRVDLSDINRWHLVVVQKRWIHSMKSCKPIGTWKEVVLKRETPLLSQLMDLCSTALDDLTLEQHKKKIFEAASGSTTTTMTSSFQIYLSHPDLMVSVLAHPSLPVPDGMRGHSAGPQGFHIIRTGFMVDMRVADLFSMLCRDYLWISNNGETFFTGSESSTAAIGTATATTSSSLFDTVKDENLKAYLMEGEGQVWELSDDTTMTVGNSQDKSEIIVEKRISVVDISSSRNIFIIVEPLKIHKKNHSRMFQLFRSAKDSFTASFQPKDSISSRHNKLVSPFHRKVSISSLHSPRPDSSTLSPSSSSSLTQLNLATDWEIDVRFNQLLCDLKITSDDQQQPYLSWNRTRKWKAISTGNLLDEPHPNPKESIDLLNARASFLTTCSSSINTTPPCSPLKPSSSRAINTSLVSPRRVVSPNPLLSQDEDLTTTSLNASQEIIQETISKLSTRPNLPNRKIIKYLRRIHESLVYHFYYQHYNDDDDEEEDDDDDELENDDQDDCCYNVNSLKPDGKLDETDRLETQVVEVISGTIGTAAATRSIEVLLEAFEVLQCIVSSDRDLSNHKGLFDKIFDLCVQGLMLRDSMLGNKVLSVLINMIGPSSPFLPPEKEKDPRHKLHELDLAKWVFCQRSRLALILQCVCSQFSSLGREAPQFLVLVLGLLEEGLKNTELQQVARSDHKIVLDRLAEEVLAVLESSRDLIYLYRLLHGRDWEPLVSVSTNPTTDSCTQTDEKPEEERPGLYMQSESLCESGISLSICDSIDCAQQSSTREVTFTVDTVDTSPLPDSNFTVPVAPPLPPPPPITHAGAPPPPPPPPPPPLPAKFNSKCIETKTIEDQVIPSIPLKPLFWSKVNNLHSTTDSDVCPTIWSKILKDEIFSPKKLNISEIEDILAKDKSTTAALKCATNNGNNVVNMNSSPSALNILDINRANNIAILLSRLRIPANDIALCIKSCRPLDTLTRKSVISGRRPLTLDNLKALCKCIPTPDELKLFKAISQTEAEALKGPELYVYQLSRIYRLAPRLTILTFMMRFEEEDAIPSLCSRFLAWQKGLKQLQSSRLLERFIAIVLGLGNVMNFGSVRGKATAFSLDILFKLRDFRVSTTSTTKTSAVSVKNLFDYIGGKVMVEEQQGSHDAFNLCLRKELDQIPKLISMGLEDDIMAVRDIKQNMDRISREIEEHSGSYPKDDIIFIQVLSEFRRTHGKSVTDLCDLMEKSLLLVEETARYFTLVSVDASREVSVKAIVTFSVQMAQLLQQDSTK